MDPNTIVLDISSDEEDFTNHDVTKGLIDSADAHNWITELLDEVNANGDCGFGDLSDDSDDVVVVSEVVAKKPRRRLVGCDGKKKGGCLDDDDDCVIVDKDPDKGVVTRNDDPDENNEDEGEDDDLVVVSETGQVACRDYPHSRHLCIKFPFSSTPNQSHCDQCYCYVCDSLAPCIYWGNGSSCLDHCQATDKDDFWKLERQNSRIPVLPTLPPTNPVPATLPLTNPVPATLPNSNPVPATLPLTNPVPPTLPTSNPVQPTLPPTNLVTLTVNNHVPSTVPVGSYPISSDLGVLTTINHNQTLFSSKSKFQPSLVSQQLSRTSSCTFPRDRTNHNYNLTAPFHKPVFKRTVSGSFVAPTLGTYGSNMLFMENYRNNNYSGSSQQPDFINSSIPFTQPNLGFEESLPKSNTHFDYSTYSQPSVNSDPFAKTPASQLQGQSSLPNYPISSAASLLEAQSQRSTFDPKFFNDINWPQSQTTHLTVAESSIHADTGPINVTAHANGCGGSVNYGYDSWMFNNQPCEPESIHDSGPFGLNEFSPEPAFIDTSTIFDF